jgi:hypothetical protein
MAYLLFSTCLFKRHVRTYPKAYTASHLARTVTFTNTRDTALRQQRVEKRSAFSLNCANEAPSVRITSGPLYVRDHARRFVFTDNSTPLIDCLQWRETKLITYVHFREILSVFFAYAMIYVLGGNFVLLRRKRVYYFRQGRSCLTVSFFAQTNCVLLKCRNTARPKTLFSYVTDTFRGQTVY